MHRKRGIALADQANFSKEFERLPPTISDLGLGLGFSIVERACKGLNYEVKLRSELGQGSCFSVEVPVQASVDAPSQVRGSVPEFMPNILLLLIEPNSEEARALTAIIEDFGPTVIYAHFLTEALGILADTQLVPDALLLAAPSDLCRSEITACQDFLKTMGFSIR